jgi:hypothetical protein
VKGLVDGDSEVEQKEPFWKNIIFFLNWSFRKMKYPVLIKKNYYGFALVVQNLLTTPKRNVSKIRFFNSTEYIFFSAPLDDKQYKISFLAISNLLTLFAPV